MDLWKKIYANVSNRPTLLPDEYTVYICDHIGVYQGRSKIVNRQNGRIYLTNFRLIYFDNDAPDHNMALDLANVTSFSKIDGFLKRSPKVKLYLKSNSETTATNSPSAVMWVCKICSFNNTSRPIYLDDAELVCANCGVPASPKDVKLTPKQDDQTTSSHNCPSCTFTNHPSMKTCEMCGTPLKKPTTTTKPSAAPDAPQIIVEGGKVEYSSPDKPYIKLSFRKGGDTKFCRHLQQILDDIHWNQLRAQGKINSGATRASPALSDQPKVHGGGISGLEQLGEQRRQYNETVLTTSLDDLEQLMFKYEDLLKLTGQRTELIKPPVKLKTSGSSYIPELARAISEYCLQHALTKRSAMITTQELFTQYNRYLVTTQGFGVKLISAADFDAAIAKFTELRLPLVLKRYSSAAVVAPTNGSNYQEDILKFMKQQHRQWIRDTWVVALAGASSVAHDVSPFFRGNTVAEICAQFNWNYNIAMEELDQCIDAGVVVVDESIEGTFYFLNIFDPKAYDVDEAPIKAEVEQELAAQQQEISGHLKSQFDRSHALVSFANYTFGDGVDSSEPTATPSPVSSHLNDLSGLTF
ncbi:hypothetical protein DIURU_000551 [Diutina rugosa]|uniref:Vacuolar protein-sorting-associated protein 36 n=1 Tax=Diutina rugosa TaxID=5481 RepID=A0A642V2H1_DIURU|nr:uncharacterized protein DIURU_000551 [Diutina rugosa]KAA8907389.1 hypothetical protein DIURU_000551 [Diutina rugosa]